MVAYGPLLLAIPVAMVAGLVSFLSPRCLPRCPATSPTSPAPLGPTRNRRPSTRQPHGPRRSGYGLLFVLGFAAVYTSYGAAFGAAGDGRT